MDSTGQVRQHLRDGEQLLWQGVPDPAVVFTGEDARLIPFSICWCAIPVLGESLALSTGVWFPGLLLIPFVAVGLYSVAGRFFYKAYRKRRTGYAITSRRAMIIGSRSFADLPLRDQPVAIKRSRDSRHASVEFTATFLPGGGAGRGRGGRRGYVPGPNTGMDLVFRNTPQPFAFYDVADPEAMIRALERAVLGDPA